ncbi:amino acid ABC transporter substrate-binding protein [Vibrio albus]|uniref:Amino acid ABC transporter substrate-binding protein n=1 Tax=Vibrio albus TaxID=2200953 RepID=A0A2U3BBZ7_9VIBR|nr:transporter substrate-binding domain-containing protein [Vibrio albus]PWI34309.1 amino acid ABC transporter substrate-binding protein [Vibrio albus]
MYPYSYRRYFYLILFALLSGLTFISHADSTDVPLSGSDKVISHPITEVIYPPAQSAFDTRDNDFIEILRLALEKTEVTDGPFTLRPTDLRMNPDRFRYEIVQGRGPNVIWASTTKKREDALRSIPIPLRKGILGYRLLLIDKANQNVFSSISSKEELQQFTAGQGATWVDADILRQNNFKVIKGSTYEGMFKMLMSGRFDFFPRGINEIYDELEKRSYQYPDMVIQNSILLYYPLPKFFFVNKDNKALADRIERGLNIMIKDGTFDRVFFKYNHKDIELLHSHPWKVFQLENPFLPDNIPFDREDLWYNLLEPND